MRNYQYVSTPMLVGVDCLRMRAFCDRNRWVQGLLHSNAKTPLSLIPSLCKAVTQSPRMAPTLLFAGVLATDDAIGYVGRQKRVGSLTK
jgi:hypothetical protein